MTEKNRFSSLLERLMTVAELKNYTLAQELQYDVSYISKWINGRVLPSEKTEKSVLHTISQCIVDAASEKGLEILLDDYAVQSQEELKAAIFDNLEAEYKYVIETQKNYGSSVAPKIFFFPELNLSQYIAKTQHPVLRRVKSLEIMALMDLMTMDHEYRLQVVGISQDYLQPRQFYPKDRNSLMIHLDVQKWDVLFDTLFLVNMMRNLTHIDFRLYGGEQAKGRANFVVKDDFSISGMLISESKCMAVTVCEEESSNAVLYRNIDGLCSRENLLFQKVVMSEMLRSKEYIHTMLAPNQRWLIGHMTEQFLPDDLFEEIVEQLSESGLGAVSVEEFRNIHDMSKRIIEGSKIRLMFYESAFSDLAVSGELDFFNYKIVLTASQRLRYLEYVLNLWEHNPKLDVRLIYGSLISDFRYIANQCIFLSDVFSYLRLDNCGSPNNLTAINLQSVQSIFDQFYQSVWTSSDKKVFSDRQTIISYMKHIMQGIALIANPE